MNIQSKVLERSGSRPILIDYRFEDSIEDKPWIIFAHGFKGYKDWGAWNLVADYFAKAGFVFLKFNFSCNGGTIENPIDFPDLTTFSENTYTKEQEDLHEVINWVSNQTTSKIHLIGHSRGGAAVYLHSQNEKVAKIISWAGVSDLFSRISEDQINAWENEGVFYTMNGRTKQNMPMKKSFYDDLIQNKSRLDIRKTLSKSSKSILAIHCKDDLAVDYSDSEVLPSINSNIKVELLETGGHTFNTKHPWEEENLPEVMRLIVSKSVEFLKS